MLIQIKYFSFLPWLTCHLTIRQLQITIERYCFQSLIVIFFSIGVLFKLFSREVEQEGREIFYLVMRMMSISLPGIPWHLRFKVKFLFF